MADAIVYNATAIKAAPQATDTLPKTDSPERLDWEATIEKPPVRSSGTLRVKLEYAGRAKPIAFPDPEAE